MLIVAPSGSTNRVTRRSIFSLSSRFRKVTGSVAPLKMAHTVSFAYFQTVRYLDAVPKAVAMACSMPVMKSNGLFRVNR